MKKGKKSTILLCTLLGLSLANTSCHKDHVYDSTKVDHTSELDVPAGFDWNTTRTVEFSVSSSVATVARIYSDKTCSSESLLASLPASPAGNPLQLEVPAATQEIYIQYPTSSGNKVMAVTLSQSTTKAATEIKLPEDAYTPETIPDLDGKLYRTYHKWTLMFEDNWPTKGDYDFNDFVIDYVIRTDYTLGTSAQDYDSTIYTHEGISVTVKFRAIGGKLPYRLGLQLDKTQAKYFDETDLPKTVNGITVSLQNPKADEPAIFIFEGLDKLKGQNNALYFNTEADHRIASDDLPEISFRLKMNCFSNRAKSQALVDASYSRNHNFFLQLQGNGGKEIHLRGYEPTKYYTSYTKDAKDLMNPDIKYYSEDGFVWGFKVPYGTSHAIETIDFKDAYSHFAQWVISGGKENLDWFNYPEPSNLIQ